MHSSIEASVLSSTGKLSPYLWVEQHTVTYNVKINIVLKFVEELLQMEDDPVPNYLPSSTRGRHDCEQGGTCSYEPTSLDTRLAVDPTPSSSTAYCHAHFNAPICSAVRQCRTGPRGSRTSYCPP
jgi:hypothetical protein